MRGCTLPVANIHDEHPTRTEHLCEREKDLLPTWRIEEVVEYPTTQEAIEARGKWQCEDITAYQRWSRHSCRIDPLLGLCQERDGQVYAGENIAALGQFQHI